MESTEMKVLTVGEAWTELCETPDITSPEEYPDHALITMEQLGNFLERANPAPSFQARVKPWMLACFGEAILADQTERTHRFLEEALELVQSCGCSQSEAHQLVDYVYGRPTGEPNQEVGGVMVTLAALCLTNSLDMHAAAETELTRVWTKIEAIRAKHAAKPKHSPLPGPSAADLAAPADNSDDLERAKANVLLLRQALWDLLEMTEDPEGAPAAPEESVFAFARAALQKTSGEMGQCPICATPFKPEDICATDIEMGTCHAACLEGSPVVDLDSGEVLPDSEVDTFQYGDTTEGSADA
ncbi:hypothetical protein ACQZ4Q_01350 [Agrobacterium vitis]